MSAPEVDYVISAARNLIAAIRRTHDHTEWFAPAAALMRALDALDASTPPPSEEKER